MLDAKGKRRCDKQTDMWNMIVLKDRIRTSSHNDAVLFGSQVTDQVTHVKKYCVLFWKSVISVKFPEPFPWIKLMLLLIFIEIRKIFRIIDRTFFRLKTS